MFMALAFILQSFKVVRNETNLTRPNESSGQTWSSNLLALLLGFKLVSPDTYAIFYSNSTKLRSQYLALSLRILNIS